MGESAENPAQNRARGVRRARGVQHPLADYAAQLDCSERTVKSWLKIGRAAQPPDPCPLDDPGRLAAWWSRHMKHAVPDRLLRLAQELPAPPAPKTPQVSEDGLPLFGQSGQVANLPQVVEVGFSASLKRIRQAEAAASKAYSEAITAQKDAGEIELARRVWNEAFDSLRKAEKDGAELLKLAGTMLNRDELKRALIPRHRAIVVGLRNFLRRVRPKISGVSPAEQDRVWHQETEELLRWLCENEFTGKLEFAA